MNFLIRLFKDVVKFNFHIIIRRDLKLQRKPLFRLKSWSCQKKIIVVLDKKNNDRKRGKKIH